MNEKFKVGDVVCLNSTPGIKLTIIKIENDEVSVSYYSGERQKFESEKFPIDALSKYKKPDLRNNMPII